uniref:RING-type E3 ubiquitin transferase (cysteine targeting) n=1 Tax=Ciona savignyi TaxID=51511 RepID=H2ZF05_CIOSA
NKNEDTQTMDLPPALRVAQLDMSHLDDYLMQQFSNKLTECFRYPIFESAAVKLEPCVRTTLYGLLLHQTLLKSGQTIGQKLLGIKYHTKSLKLLKLWCGIMLLNYGYENFKKAGIVNDSKLVEFIRKVCSFATLFNFVWFIRQGDYHSLLLRVLGLKTVYDKPNPPERNVTFPTVSREILWHGYAETAVYFFSYVNIDKLRSLARKILFKPSEKEAAEKALEEIYDKCSYCAKVPIMPHTSNCKIHAHCYNCVAISLATNSNCECPICLKPIGNIMPLKILNRGFNKIV